MCKIEVSAVSTFRRVLPQVIATTVKNLLLLDMGIGLAIPTVIIAATTGNKNKCNYEESLSFTSVEATWIGSIFFLFQPLGSLLSILITDSLGRRRSMMIVNLPIIIGLIMMYQGDNFWKVLFGCILMGLGSGLMEAPILTYVGEICEPSTRGMLVTYSSLYVPLGISLVFYINTVAAWRSMTMGFLILPVISVIALCFIPETPHWLLSKNRKAEAEKALRWLRGWVSNETVAHEFRDLQWHSDRSKACIECNKQNLKCPHPLPTMREKFAELKRKRTIKPFIIIIPMFFMSQFADLGGMRPFIVHIFEVYNSPIPGDHAAELMSLLSTIASIILIFVVRILGKRCTYLSSLTGIFLSTAILSCYGFIYLPIGFTSFDSSFKPAPPENTILGYIPMICLIAWSCFSWCGLVALPWMMLSEIFGFKSRGIASSFAAAFSNILGFVGRKTYYSLETTISLPGVSLSSCILSGFGLILFYLILPETENHSLVDIELHFSDNSKKITDRIIVKQNRKEFEDVEMGSISETSKLYTHISLDNNFNHSDQKT